jgi:hypothetical protein
VEIVKSFPTGRKTAQNSLDMTPGLVLSLMGREGCGARHSHRVARRIRTNAQTDAERQDQSSDTGEVRLSRWRGKSGAGDEP